MKNCVCSSPRFRTARLSVSTRACIGDLEHGADVCCGRHAGKSVVDRLAGDVQNSFPGIEGFSPRNIWRMRVFYLGWIDGTASSILPRAVMEIPWGHNVVLIEQLKDAPRRLWYAEQIVATAGHERCSSTGPSRIFTRAREKQSRISGTPCRRHILTSHAISLAIRTTLSF
jgi:hypothetical protein